MQHLPTPVRIEVDGDVVAESTRARLLFETSLRCASTLPREDLGWSYQRPLPDAVAITGLVAFWDERVDVFLDGERRERPGGAISEALLDEFGL